MTPKPPTRPDDEREPLARVPVGPPAVPPAGAARDAGGAARSSQSGAAGGAPGVTDDSISPADSTGGAPSAAAPPRPAGEKMGAWVREFALYPFFIVLGVVGVFTLLSFLLRQDETPMDFLQQLHTARGNDRWYAAYQLSNLIGRKGEELRLDPLFVGEVRQIFEQSDDEDPRLQRYLAIVLGRVGDATAVPVLARALTGDDDAETRAGSAWALGALAKPEGVPALLAALDDSDSGVRKVAAYALGSMKEPRAVVPLRARLDDPADDVRWNAALALAQLGDPAGFPVLREMVNLAALSRVEGMTDERIKEAMLNAVKALGLLQAVSPSARVVLEETSRTAPFPLVQQEARRQIERGTAPAKGP